MSEEKRLLLGLIGDNIARSRAPDLHRLAGAQNGLSVRYDRLVPKTLGRGFEQVFEDCAQGGYRGINVTYPYKERAAPLTRIDDPLARGVGAVNTVLFEADGARGCNTDYSGFIAAYAQVRSAEPPGCVLMIGAGGVGRAAAFALARLGAAELRLTDRDPAKADALADALQRAAPQMKTSVWIDAEKAAEGACGLINCTPVGMVGYEGTPLPRQAMKGAQWAFDAVYTPVDTQFLTEAAAEGLAVISGYELFFYQGVHAWRLFSGLDLDEAALRRDLLEGAG